MEHRLWATPRRIVVAMPEVSKTVTKLFSELVKHQAKKHLGEGVFDVLAGGAAEVGGQVATERVSALVSQGANAEKLLAAFRRADSCFAKRCDDRALKQAITSQPLAGLPSLEKLAASLTDSLDDDSLFRGLRLRFAEDWTGQLSDEQLNRAASLYRNCLDRALAATCGQLLPTLYRKIERIEALMGQVVTGQLAPSTSRPK